MPTLTIIGTGSSTYCYIQIGSSTTKRYTNGYSTTVSTGTNITLYVRCRGVAYSGNCTMDVSEILGYIRPEDERYFVLYETGEYKKLVIQMPKTNIELGMSYNTTLEVTELFVYPTQVEELKNMCATMIDGTTHYSESYDKTLIGGAIKYIESIHCRIQGTSYFVPTRYGMKWLKKPSETATTGEVIYEESNYYPAYGEYDGYWYELQPKE